MKTCHHCNLPATNPQPWEEHTQSWEHKRTGWIGDQFIPYERVRARKVVQRKITLCGLCMALAVVETYGEEYAMSMKDEIWEMIEKELAGRANQASSNDNGNPLSKPNVSRKRKGRKAKRAQMTADEARSFDGYSETNTNLLTALLECSCSPYLDVYTYARGQAQGFQVRKMDKSKGEGAYKLPLYRTVEKEDDEGNVKQVSIPAGNSNVFCRCQVDEMKACPELVEGAVA